MLRFLEATAMLIYFAILSNVLGIIGALEDDAVGPTPTLLLVGTLIFGLSLI